jgi:hypothetical protein
MAIGTLDMARQPESCERTPARSTSSPSNVLLVTSPRRSIVRSSANVE